MSLPALQALRQRYPGAHIAILARPWVLDLYARDDQGREQGGGAGPGEELDRVRPCGLAATVADEV